MGYGVTGHIVREQVDTTKLQGLGADWRVYRDAVAGAWLVDVFVSDRGRQWPFVEDPSELGRALGDPDGSKEAPALFKVFAHLDLDYLVQGGVLAMNTRLSGRLDREVLSFTTGDDDVDMACWSASGFLQGAEQALTDAVVRWAPSGISVQPFNLPEDPDMLTDFREIKRMKNVEVLARNGDMSNELHNVAKRGVRNFLAGGETFLDLGSFDCLARVPAPIAQS